MNQEAAVLEKIFAKLSHEEDGFLGFHLAEVHGRGMIFGAAMLLNQKKHSKKRKINLLVAFIKDVLHFDREPEFLVRAGVDFCEIIASFRKPDDVDELQRHEAAELAVKATNILCPESAVTTLSEPALAPPTPAESQCQNITPEDGWCAKWKSILQDPNNVQNLDSSSREEFLDHIKDCENCRKISEVVDPRRLMMIHTALLGEKVMNEETSQMSKIMAEEALKSQGVKKDDWCAKWKFIVQNPELPQPASPDSREEFFDHIEDCENCYKITEDLGEKGPARLVQLFTALVGEAVVSEEDLRMMEWMIEERKKDEKNKP